jgi:hypothetical protein
LSFLWPGLGQLFLGRRVAAAILALPALVVAIVAVAQLSGGALLFAASLWDQSYFLAVVAAVAGFGVWRALALGNAFVAGSRGRRPRRREVAFVAALLVVIAATHGLVVAGAWVWYETSVSIQNNDLFAVESPTAVAPTPTPVPTPTPADTSSFQPYATTGPTAEPTPIKTPTPTGLRSCSWVSTSWRGEPIR